MTSRSPQTEDGFVRIANELLEAILAYPFKQTHLRVLLAVLRKTYGYGGKKEDDLSASQLATLCVGMKRQHVTTALNELAALGVISKRPGVYGCIVGIVKDYSLWSDSPKLGQGVRKPDMSETRTGCPDSGHVQNSDGVSEKGTLDSPNFGQVDSPNFGHTKDNLPKDNQQKESASADSCGEQLPLPPAEADGVPPPVTSLPLNDGSEHLPAERQVAEWSAAYPTVDVLGELKKMRVWLAANPTKAKTRRGIDRFIVHWLGNSQRDAIAARAAGKPSGVIHGNFGKQDYRSGIAEDGRF